MKHSKLVHSIVFFLLVGGCQSALNLTKQASDFQSLIACEQATVILTDKDGGNTPNTPSKKYKRSECPECHGTGFIVSGDGLFKQNCPYCEATADSSFGDKSDKCSCKDCACKKCECKKGENCCCAGGQDCSKYNVSKSSSWQCPCGGVCQCMNGECKSPNCPTNRMGQTASIQKKCCQDCICQGNCQCKYPGECLVKRNGGKPVKVCDQKSCREYRPQSPTTTLPKSNTSVKPIKKTSSYLYSNGQRAYCAPGGS